MKFFDRQTIEKIRRGYYTAVYFNRTKEILLKENKLASVTMQVFQKNEGSILAGVEEVGELLKVGSGYWSGSWIDKYESLTVFTLGDGDRISRFETVMHIKGSYAYFAHLESLYLGILARRTVIATNVRRCVDAAEGKQIIFFADRFDHFFNQEGDGYAAKVGGATAVCTDAMSKGFGERPVGTIPHALIAVYGGNTVEATDAFAKHYPDVNLIALVDFENDCVRTSLLVARKFGERLWGVRLDTTGEMVDKSLQYQKSTLNQNKYGLGLPRTELRSGTGANNKSDEIYGVNPKLVRSVRCALDSEGFGYVRIVVSGGFTPEKIAKFTDEKVPVDAYGVGSSLVKGANDFTADIVEVEGKKIAKVGREYKANSRLKPLKYRRNF